GAGWEGGADGRGPVGEAGGGARGGAGAELAAGADGRRVSARGAAGSAPDKRLACAVGAALGVASACWRISRWASSTRRSTSSSDWGTGRRVERTVAISSSTRGRG